MRPREFTDDERHIIHAQIDRLMGVDCPLWRLAEMYERIDRGAQSCNLLPGRRHDRS
jgi:hypothetical protein